jgi:hypothetical protein
VIARRWHRNTILTILNGTTKKATMKVARYAEVIGKTSQAEDVITGQHYVLSKDLELAPRQTLVLEYLMEE